MQEIINEKVSALVLYDRMKNITVPKKMRWQGRDYSFTALNYYHKISKGKFIFHVFHLTDGMLDFRLSLNSQTLQVILEEVSDGSVH